MRQAWGLDEPQGFWSAFGKNLAYNTWNVISLGTLGRQDTLVEQYEAGQITDEQYWGRTAINAGSSVAIGAAAAATGGLAGVAASSLGAGAVATGAIAGAVAGIGGQAATDILEVGALGTKSLEDVSATDYLIAGGGGLVLGGLAGKAFGGSRASVSRQPAGSASKATTVVETAPPPKALSAGRQPRALIGPRGDPGLTGAPARGGARFIADADGGVLDLTTMRGRLNPVGRQGPFNLPRTPGSAFGLAQPRTLSPVSRVARAALRRGFERVGRSTSLPYRQRLTLGVRAHRTFVTATRRHAPVSASPIGRQLQRLPGLRRIDWEQGHVFLQQRWWRHRGPTQWYQNNPAANLGMRRVGNAGFNLAPMPRSLNRWMGRHPWASFAVGVGASTSVPGAFYGGYQLGGYLYDQFAER